MIKSISKFWQTEETLRIMTQKAIQQPLITFSYQALDGGYCNAVYEINANGQSMVLKIAPKDSIEMLSDEKNLLLHEANMLNYVNDAIDIPIPKVILFDPSCELCESPYLFMTKIEGTSYDKIVNNTPEDVRAKIRFTLGEITAKINSIKCRRFGLIQLPETWSNNNADTMLKIYRMLLDDGISKNLDLRYINYDELWELLLANRDALEDCKSPALIHSDIWAGNIIVKDNSLSGIIDFERMRWGDYLLEDDFSGFGGIDPNFLKGYGKTSFTPLEERRIVLYQIWRRLAMTIETPYRQYDDKGRFDWITSELHNSIIHLKELMN